MGNCSELCQPASFVLHENHLTSDPDDYRATVHMTGTVELEGVIDRMIERGSTTTKADILAVLEDYHAAIESLVLEGFSVLTPGANYGASIKGVFDGPADSFEASRHAVEATVNPGAQLRQAIRNRAQAHKGEAVIPRPNPVITPNCATSAPPPAPLGCRSSPEP